jgi:hypothetical protein
MEYMKKFIIVLLLITGLVNCTTKKDSKSTAVPSFSALSTTDISSISNREIASWEFAKTKQLDKLNEILADDYQAFFGKIIMNKSEVLQSFQKTQMTAYRLSNIRVKKLADNVAVIYYEALQDAIDPEGRRWVPQIAASVTYVKRDNIWYAIFYHETPLTP